MATLDALNAAVNGTAINSTEYNDNMTRIRASVNSVAAAQLASDSVITAKILDANVTEAKLSAAVQAKLLDAAGEMANGTSDITIVENGKITMDVAGTESFAFDTNGILTLAKQSCATMTKSATQAFSATTWTKVTFNGTDHDQQSEFSDANDRWVCTTAGQYLIIGVMGIDNSDANEIVRGAIYKDGSAISTSIMNGNTTGTEFVVATCVTLAAAEYIELFGYYNSSTREFTVNTKLIVVKVA